MRDPNLAPSLFDRDRVLSRETLFDARYFAGLSGARSDGESAEFSSSGRLFVTIPASSKDLSRFNRLSLIVFNRIPGTLLVGVRLLRRSPYGWNDQNVSFTGGREELPWGRWHVLLFPQESFGTYGATTDWTDVQTIEFSFGYDRTHEGPGGIEIAIQALNGEYRDISCGPRLTVDGLTEVLKIGTSISNGLAAAEPGDGLPGARSCQENAHMLHDEGLRVPPPHPYPQETADEILAGRILGQYLGHRISWDANPLGIQEWTHFLNRHHFMRTLVIAWVESRDARYATALNRHISSWIEDNPVPVGSNGGAAPGWETLSSAWRLREWVWVRRCTWTSTSMNDRTRGLMLRSVWEHACHLIDHRGHPNNWVMVESCALALAGIWFREFRDAELWLRTGVERLTTEFRRQFFPDGTHFEISPLYHAICAHAMLEVRQSAITHDLDLPEEFHHPLERCFTYLAALCRPDLTWPSLNDGGSADSDYTALMRMAGHAFARQDLLWLGTRGKLGVQPESVFHVFPDAGIAAMRSGYSTDANVLIFRAGPAGAAHVHDDVLGLDVTALGVPRLVDPGITTYAPDLIGDYYRSAIAHNTVLVDDIRPCRSAEPFTMRVAPAEARFAWSSGDDFSAAFGAYRNFTGEASQEFTVHRAVIFVGGEYWIVQDGMVDDCEHDIVTNWQFFPARIQFDLATGRARTLDARGPQFEIIPVQGFNEWELDYSAGSYTPVRGWASLGGTDVPCFSVRYRTRVRGLFVQEWILLPFRGRLHAGLNVIRSGRQGETTDLQISFADGKIDYVSVGPMPLHTSEEVAPREIRVRCGRARD